MDKHLEKGIAFLDITIDYQGDVSSLLLCISTNDDLPRGSLHYVSRCLKWLSDTILRAEHRPVYRIQLYQYSANMATGYP